MSEDRGFYVGYLPLPRAHKVALGVCVPITLMVMLASAILATGTMRAGGDGTWDTSHEREWVGVLRLDPYPALTTGDGDVLLVVEMGKHGAFERTGGFEGKFVRVRGYGITRQGRSMIELAGGEGTIEVVDTVDPAKHGGSEIESLGEVELVGEVVDSKCYLGAMRPGDGVGHRSCAALCVRGGIPPSLVTKGIGGEDRFLLLVGADGGSLCESFWELAGSTIRVRGELEILGENERLRVETYEVE